VTCREVADFLMDYLDGDLSPTQREVFEKHLKLCPECVAYMQSYEITIKASKSAGAQSDDRDAPEVPDELVRAILAARKKDPR
jgi:anti-sigma factor RsiW